MNKEKTRVFYLDIIRVFSIVMVFVLHCICDYYNNSQNAGKALWTVLSFVQELTRTGVPLFFMISGYLLLSRPIDNVAEFYKKRFMKVFIPFIIYDVLYYFCYTYQNGAEYSVIGFLRELVNNGSAYHLWFIYTILFLYILIPFMKMIIDKCDFKLLMLFFVITIFQTTIKPFINSVANGYITFYFTPDAMFGYFGYMLLGYILGSYDITVKIRNIIYLAGISFFVIIPVLSMRSVIGGGDYLFHGGYMLNHYAEAAAIFVFCKYNMNRKSTIIKSLSSVSFGAYFIHVFILIFLRRYGFDARPSLQMVYWIIMTTILSFLWGFIEKFITTLIRKGNRKNEKNNINSSYTNISI